MALIAHNTGTRTGADSYRPPSRPRGPIVLSPQQAAIVHEVQHGDSHLLAEARAGVGKSFVAREAARSLPRTTRVIYSCFNKHIAAEFQADLPSNCFAATMHKLGLITLKTALGADVVVDEDKVLDLAEAYFPDRWGPDRDARFAVKRLVGLRKSHLIDGDDPTTLAALAGAHGVDLGDRGEDVFAVTTAVLEDCRTSLGRIDYDDMIWLPIVLGLTFPPCDVLFVDEAQDLDAAQQQMALRLCPDGRIIVIGDRFQSVYAFRGADSDSIPTMERLLGNEPRGVVRLPLTVTRRCPRSHVELAQEIVPDLEAMDDAPDGDIIKAETQDVLDDLAPGDLALCRTNAPLLGACYHLLKQNRKAVVRGRDIGKGLLVLVARLRARTTPDLIARLEDYRVKELARINELRNPAPATMVLMDKVDCLRTLSEGAADPSEVKARIERLFSNGDEQDAVIFSSVHRSKGLEANRVAILAPNLMPHPMAKHATDQQQERNILYVAATRSKQQLTFAGSIPDLLTGD